MNQHDEITDDQLSRLPKRVQAHVDRLERRVRDAEASERAARLATLPEESDTLIDPYDKVPIGLGKGTQVRFRVGRRWYVDVRVRPSGVVEVHGADAIHIGLHSSNVLTVHPADAATRWDAA